MYNSLFDTGVFRTAPFIFFFHKNSNAIPNKFKFISVQSLMNRALKIGTFPNKFSEVSPEVVLFLTMGSLVFLLTMYLTRLLVSNSAYERLWVNSYFRDVISAKLNAPVLKSLSATFIFISRQTLSVLETSVLKLLSNRPAYGTQFPDSV